MQYKSISEETLADITEQVMPVLIKKINLLIEAIDLNDRESWFKHILVENKTKFNIS